jgi:hypothetical protein
MTGARTLVVGCGALARELRLVADMSPGLEVRCLPAILHNRPERIAPAVAEAVRRHRRGHAHVLVAFADCGTGGALARLCDSEGWQMLPGPHCYALLDPGLMRHGEGRAFYVTDFLARQFDAFVVRPLGLDRHPELRGAYFGAYETLVHLAGSDDPALETQARNAARRLGLDYERRTVGLGALPAAVETALRRGAGEDGGPAA